MEYSSRTVASHTRRNESIKKWMESDTAKASALRPLERNRIKFENGAMLLASVMAGDIDETRRLLDQGADVNYSNIDGLTSLHQACIDENFEIVEVLMSRNALVDACDNEGWTPLHAAATTTSLEIVKYLVEKGASTTAVNSEGELPVDLTDEPEIRSYLEKEMNNKNVNFEDARKIEHKVLLDDALRWKKNGTVDDIRDIQGATALHVAASKGYMDILKILLSIGVDVNCVDHDGWTPLHAAVFWKQNEVCQTLIESGANLYTRNNIGQIPSDLADEEIAPFLRTLAHKYKIPEEDSNDSPGAGSNSLKHNSMSYKNRTKKTVGIIKIPKDFKPVQAKDNEKEITIQKPPTSIPKTVPVRPPVKSQPISEDIKKPPARPTSVQKISPVLPPRPITPENRSTINSATTSDSNQPSKSAVIPTPSNRPNIPLPQKSTRAPSALKDIVSEAAKPPSSITPIIKPQTAINSSIPRPKLSEKDIKPAKEPATSGIKSKVTTILLPPSASKKTEPNDKSAKKEAEPTQPTSDSELSPGGSDVDYETEIQTLNDKVSRLKRQLETVTLERDSLRSTVEQLQSDSKAMAKLIEENKRLSSENASLTKVVTSYSRTFTKSDK